MSLLKLLLEQTAENHDKTSIRETGEPHHYALGAGISGTCFRRIDPKSYALPRLDPINRQPTDAPRELTRTPPTVPQHLFPEDGDWKFTQPVRSSTVLKVDAVRDQALSLGWSEAQLYRNRGRFRFPCGQDYGLVCFLEEDSRIGEVTRQSIEIIGPPPQENRLYFYNPDVDQPWLKTTAPGA